MKTYVLFLLLAITSHFCLAQTDLADDEGFSAEAPKQCIRLSLIHWLDPLTPGPHISYEHQIRADVYLRHELGIILDLNFEDQQSLRSLNGFRVRTGRRKYRADAGNVLKRRYREISVDFRYTNALVSGDFRRGGFSGFSQRLNYGITQHSLTFNYYKGSSLSLGKHWALDAAIGLGVRMNYRKYSSVPEDAIFDNNGSLFWRYNTREPLHFTLSAPVILALGYNF